MRIGPGFPMERPMAKTLFKMNMNSRHLKKNHLKYHMSLSNQTEILARKIQILVAWHGQLVLAFIGLVTLDEFSILCAVNVLSMCIF